MAKTEITGIIKKIFPAEVYGNFEKRVVWIHEDSARYPNTYAVEFHQGKCQELDHYREGERVSLQVDILGKVVDKNGKEMQFNTLKCWQMISVNAPSQPAKAAPAPINAEFETDLPF